MKLNRPLIPAGIKVRKGKVAFKNVEQFHQDGNGIFLALISTQICAGQTEAGSAVQMRISESRMIESEETCKKVLPPPRWKFAQNQKQDDSGCSALRIRLYIGGTFIPPPLKSPLRAGSALSIPVFLSTAPSPVKRTDSSE
jgi:hypothetical protein